MKFLALIAIAAALEINAETPAVDTLVETTAEPQEAEAVMTAEEEAAPEEEEELDLEDEEPAEDDEELELEEDEAPEDNEEVEEALEEDGDLWSI